MAIMSKNHVFTNVTYWENSLNHPPMKSLQRILICLFGAFHKIFLTSQNLSQKDYDKSKSPVEKYIKEK